MLKVTSKVLKRVDIFAIPISMTLDKKRNFKSIDGGVVSLCIIGIVLYISAIYLKDIADRKNPNYINKKLENAFSPWGIANASNFFIAVRIEDDDSKVYNDRSYFNVSLIYRHEKINKSSPTGYDFMEEKTFKMNACDETNILDYDLKTKKYNYLGSDIIKRERMGDFLCPEDTLGPHLFGGNFTTENYYFYFKVSKCNQARAKELGFECQPDSEMSARDYFIGFKVMNFVIDPEKFDEPVLKFWEYEYYRISYTRKKTLFKYFYSGSFMSDDDLFIPDQYQMVPKNGFFFGPKPTIVDDADLVTSGGGDVVELYCYLSNTKYEYKRNYMKLQDVFGIVSGFLQLFVYVVQIFTSVVKNYQYKSHFYDNLMDFKFREENSNDGEKLKTVQTLYLDNYDKKLNLSSRAHQIKKDEEVPQQFLGFPGGTDRVDVVELINKDVSNEAKNRADEISLKNAKAESGNGLLVLDENVLDANKEIIKGRKTGNNLYNASFIKENSPNDKEEDIGENGGEAENSFASDKLENSSNNQENDIDDNIVPLESIINRRSENFLKQIISFKKKKMMYKDCNLSASDIFIYGWLRMCNKCSNSTQNKHKEQILKLADNYYLEKLDLLTLIKHLDQMSLLKKVVLNQNQCFMLDNKDKKLIYNKYVGDREKIEEEIEKSRNEKVILLIEYLKNRKEQGTLDTNDLILFENLITDIKEDVSKEVKM